MTRKAAIPLQWRLNNEGSVLLSVFICGMLWNCAFFSPVFWKICSKSHEILPCRHHRITSLNKSSWSALIQLWLWNSLIETSEPPQLISDEFHISLSELFFWFVGCCVGNNYLVLLCFVSECLQMFVLLCHLVVIIPEKKSSLFCDGWWLLISTTLSTYVKNVQFV